MSRGREVETAAGVVPYTFNLGIRSEKDRREINSRARFFFAEVTKGERFPDTSAFVITHFMPGTGETLLHALSQVAPIAGVYPKRSSRNNFESASIAQQGYPIIPWRREEMIDPRLAVESMTELLGSDTQNLAILDMGGYFAQSAGALSKELGGRFRGIVEDTENGHGRYERLKRGEGIPVPIFSAARSPLKESEDYLVGQAIVLGTEEILLEKDWFLAEKTALVIGYGKLGSSIANSLSG